MHAFEIEIERRFWGAEMNRWRGEWLGCSALQEGLDVDWILAVAGCHQNVIIRIGIFRWELKDAVLPHCGL